MTIPNVVGSIAGAAQQQRFAVANFNREQAAANANYAKQLRDKILTGFLNTGISTAIGFGEKAYDEAHSGARAQQQIDQIEKQRTFDRGMSRLGAGINAPGFDAAAQVEVDTPETGYSPEAETGIGRSAYARAAESALSKARDAAPETGYGRMGRMGIEAGTSAAEGSPVQREARPVAPPPVSGVGTRETGATTPPVLAQRQRTDAEALDAMPAGDDRQMQARLIEMKKQAAEQMAAAAAADRQKREDALAKEQEANRLKSYELIGGLQTATQQRFGTKGRPSNVPQFGVQPTIDPETGIVRPEFTQQPRVRPAFGGGGGGASVGQQNGMYPGSDTIDVVRIPFTKRGDMPNAPISTQMNNVEWARQLVQNPDYYMHDAADLPLVAKAVRILDNPAAPMDVKANQIAFLDEAASRGIKKWSGSLASTREAVGFSPKDAGKEQTSDQRQQQSAAQQAADRQAAIDAQLESIKADAIKLEDDYAKDVESALGKTFKGPGQRRGMSRGGLSMQQLRDAADGDPTPDGLDQEGVAAWQAAAAATHASRAYRSRMIESFKSKAAVVTGRKQATPGGQ